MQSITRTLQSGIVEKLNVFVFNENSDFLTLKSFPEQVPCQWNGGAQGAGRAGCVGYDPDAPDAATTGGHYGVEIDGIIAPFWADLNPSDATGGCASPQRCGVYYYIAVSSDVALAAFNKVIIGEHGASMISSDCCA